MPSEFAHSELWSARERRTRATLGELPLAVHAGRRQLERRRGTGDERKTGARKCLMTHRALIYRDQTAAPVAPMATPGAVSV